jgi:hypothetical protein
VCGAFAWGAKIPDICYGPSQGLTKDCGKAMPGCHQSGKTGKPVYD